MQARSAFTSLLVATTALAVVGCSGATADGREPEPEPDTGGDGDGCDYPSGATATMTLDEVIYPYAWDVAIDPIGIEKSIDLAEVPCAADDDIDWSPFDVLLFVSIPAW
jgi:hypothetical protein